MNIWAFVGRIGRDGELRATPKGDMVLTFPVAVDSGYGDKKKTTWPRGQVWGKRAESLAPYIIKGNQIAISGEVTLNEYTNKDGQKANSLDVRASEVTLIKSGSPQRSAEPASNAGAGFDDWGDDRVPF